MTPPIRTQEVSDYIKGLEQKNRELTSKNDELQRLYADHAEAERSYNIAYAGEITKLRINGEPITISKDLARGNKAIADLFYRMRIAEGVLNSCRERIKDLRSSIDTYRSLLSFLKAEYEVSRG